jgi:GNAT superfamily N-acetyltransferase
MSGPHVRAATERDVAGVAQGVRQLLQELGGEPPAAEELERATRELLGDPGAGTVLVADAQEAVVGVLGASWQSAIHVPGRYGLIQDLWVDPGWRDRQVGRELLAAMFALAQERGIERLEVGLPREAFGGLAATEAFYAANGFTRLGTRMRRKLQRES